MAYLALRSHDPVYVLRELKDWTDYRRFDSLIVKVGREYDLDPRLIKAVVWRESRFQADMIGRNGERGFMQVSEIAARDWAAAKGLRDLHPEQMLIPELNLEIGTWYLRKAVQRWNAEDNAVPFGLAEYNAGKSRVDRWVRMALKKGRATSDRRNLPGQHRFSLYGAIREIDSGAVRLLQTARTTPGGRGRSVVGEKGPLCSPKPQGRAPARSARVRAGGMRSRAFGVARS